MVEAKLMRIYSSNCLMGKEGLKELKSYIGTDTQLQTDAAQPSDLDFQQMSQGSSRPISKCIIYINISLLPLLSNHYSSLRNIKKLQCSLCQHLHKEKDKEMCIYPTPPFSKSYNCWILSLMVNDFISCQY